jgi:hypothetical protein
VLATVLAHGRPVGHLPPLLLPSPLPRWPGSRPSPPEADARRWPSSHLRGHGSKFHEHSRPCLLSGLRNVSRCGDFRRRRGWARRRWRRWPGRATTSCLVSFLPAFLLTWTFRRTGALRPCSCWTLALFFDSVSEMCVAEVIEWDHRQLLCWITWYRCTKTGVQFYFVSAGRSTQLLSEVLLCMCQLTLCNSTLLSFTFAIITVLL